MTPQEFASGMNFLGQAYGKEFDRNQLNVWYSFFKNETQEDFKQALVRIISKSKFMPSIAEIKEELRTIQNTFLLLLPEEEWAKVQKAIGKYGFYNAEEAEASFDPFTAKVVRNMGGFRKICMAEDNDWSRKNFMRLWENMKDSQRSVLLPDTMYLTASEKQMLPEYEELRQMLRIGSEGSV